MNVMRTGGFGDMCGTFQHRVTSTEKDISNVFPWRVHETIVHPDRKPRQLMLYRRRCITSLYFIL
jgi:hypothetical protein